MLTIIWVALILALGVSSYRFETDSEAFVTVPVYSDDWEIPVSAVDDFFGIGKFQRTPEDMALLEKHKMTLAKGIMYLPSIIQSSLGILLLSLTLPFLNTGEDIRRNDISVKDATVYKNSASDARNSVYSPLINYSDQVTFDDATYGDSLVPPYKMESIDRRSGLPGEVEESTSEYASEEPCSSVCDKSPLQVGSMRGIPGEHFPDYEDIPITSFRCKDKCVPGFYSDLETGCQVFHVCWPHRRESFLCPIGTIFNQATLGCDYWYSFNCSLAPLFFEIEPLSPRQDTSSTSSTTEHLHTTSQAEMLTTTRVPPTSEMEEPSEATTDYTTSRATTSKYTPTDGNNCLTSKVWSSLKLKPVKSRIAIYADSVKSTDATESISIRKQMETVAKERKIIVTFETLRAILKATENIARDARNLMQKMENEKAKRPIKESVKVQLPKVEAKSPVRLEDLPRSQSQPKPLPKINPRFVVRPVFVGAQMVKAKSKLEGMKQFKNLYGSSKVNVSEMEMKSLKFVGSVPNDDILPLTRKVLIESHAKLAKAKKH